jgi:hypothetical protein
MAVKSVDVGLTGMTESGIVTADDFLAPLRAEAQYPIARVSPGGARWQSGVVEFAVVSFEDFQSEAEPRAAFERALTQYLESIADWLGERTASILAIVSRGTRVELTIAVEIDLDQFEIVVPTKLAVAAGNASIPITIHSYV